METFLNQLKNGTLMMNKPNANGYYYAIGCSILVYVALCVLVFLTYEWWNWMLFVIAGLLIVIFSILEFHLVKALLSAREEALKPYHKAEQKLACVYEKVMDEYFDAVKKDVHESCSHSNDDLVAGGTPKIELTQEDRKKNAYIQILDAYIAHLKKSDNLRFENVEEIKKMVDELSGV